VKPMLHHQADGLAFLRRRNWRGALFMEPGLGKTRLGIEVARQARRTLVMAPLNPAEYVWPQQCREWGRGMSMKLVRGSPKERARILFDEKPDIAVLNYELAHWLYDEVRARRRLPYDVCLLDESTYVKTADSVTFNVMKALRPAFDAMIPMTGTPAENSLTDVWGQLYMVDGGDALGKRVGVFRERYCRAVVRENYATWVVSRAAELRQDAAPLCFVRRADDCLDMPPLVFRDVEFALSPTERKYYERVKKDHVVTIGDEAFTLDNAGVALDKLRQITSGFVYDEERVPHRIGDSKARALVECVEEAQGRPMLIGFWYQGSKVAIRRALGHDVPAIDRFTPRREKAMLFDMWRDGELPLLLGQIKTVALGMNMQSPEGSVLFYDMPWSHGQHWQFIRRVWRQGQTTRVVARRLIARQTVDNYVAYVLRKKQREEESLMSTILDEELI
jgi:SNF2 family DNA or RNA helicase